MKTLCFHSLEHLRPHAGQLDELNRASRLKSPFTTFAFLESFTGDAELWILVALQSGALTGYLVLQRVLEHAGPFRIPRLGLFRPRGLDCGQLVARPEDEARVGAEFYRFLLSHGDEWSVLELLRQQPGAALSLPLAEVDLRRYYVRSLPGQQSNVIRLEWPTLADYFGAMTRKFRQNVRRQVRRVMAQGRVTIVSSKDPAPRAVLFELAEIVAARSRITRHCPDRLERLRPLLTGPSPLQVWICVLMLEGRPIAAAVCGEYESTLYNLCELYDASLARIAPGTMLRLITIRHAILERYAAVDLLPSSSVSKARWLTEPSHAVTSQLFRRGTLPHWKARLGEWKRRYRGALEDLPPDEPGETGPSYDLTAAESASLEALLRRLDLLGVDRLSHAEVALLMPFDTLRSDRADPGRGIAEPIPLSSRMH